MPSKKTHEQFEKEVKETFGNDFEVITQYEGARKPMTLRHNACGHEWTAKPTNIMKTHGCPKCTQLMLAKNRIIPKDEFLKRLSEIHPNIEMIGDYVDYTTRVKFKCKIDGNEWEEKPSQILKLKFSCGVCAGTKVMPGYNSFNDIKPEFAQYLVKYEEGFQYTANSKSKLKFRCPDCGQISEKSLINLKDRFSCQYCSDGISYPEKFFYAFLKQIYDEKQIIKQKSIKTDSKTYRYDFFISDKNIIFEVHGLQHYEEGFKNFHTNCLKNNIENDKIKKDLAIASGIPESNYIVVDARESNQEYIKNSILNNPFFSGMDLSKINWNSCAKFALSSAMIKAISKYNGGTNISDIADEFKMNKRTIENYLKKGNELNLCDYDSKTA